jgi:hypothetical protein
MRKTSVTAAREIIYVSESLRQHPASRNQAETDDQHGQQEQIANGSFHILVHFYVSHYSACSHRSGQRQ